MEELYRKCIDDDTIEVSRIGNVRRADGTPVKVSYNKKGYAYVYIPKIGNSKQLHRVIYEAFNGKIPENKEIDHADGNKRNNNLSNLKCVTHAENMMNKITSKTQKDNATKFNKEKLAKPVIRYETVQGLVFEKEYPSAMEASRQTGVAQPSISSCCQGKLKTAGGYKWCYKNEEGEE